MIFQRARRRVTSEKRPAPKLEGVAFKTAFGWAGAAASARGLRHLVLPHPSRAQAESRLKRCGARVLPSSLPSFQPLVQAVQGYFEGKPVNLDFPLDLSSLPPFTRRVMSAARKIQWGKVRTYGQLAAAAGSPRAARAVGAVMAKNPLALAVP
ncbi:MAG: methylated-DNA--[protein]-cysteine S-methyltransferase [Nitrospinota bacterium]